jgi:ABC-type nitrate/sulfonate/bicarbonate transport system ATPase subunit
MADNPPILEFNSVCKSFKQPRQDQAISVLQDLSFKIENEEAGEFIALLGPSGSGKSTILNLISGMLMPESGSISINGKPITIPNTDSVTVPQAYTCFPWRTVQGNVEFGLEVQGKSKADRSKLAVEYLEKVGLADRKTAMPKELSGGMQQRVAIARTLAMRPAIMLMDEPFGALDAQTRSDMQQMLLRVWEAEKNLIFFITHDIAEALLLANRVLVLGGKPARIVQDIKVPFSRPRDADLTANPLFAGYVQQILAQLREGAQILT